MKLKAILFSVIVILALQAVAQNAAPAAQDQKDTSASGHQDAKQATAPAAQNADNATAPAGNATADASAAQPAPEVDKNTYVIGAGDSLNINVWKEKEISGPVPVRPDGRITIPLVGDVQASGLTPHQLETELTKQLASYVSSPSVTVVVVGVHSHRYNIMGMVARPGTYELAGPPSTVLDAIAVAGGLRDFAKQKKIYILRTKTDGTQEKLPFNYKEVIKGENMTQNVVLQTGDTIVVP